jgi:transcriptional regulator with XRE-family HTH domain
MNVSAIQGQGPGPDVQARCSIGSIISTLRKQNGLTQKEFAAALGVGRSSVALWETDRGGETPHIARIAELLGASVEVFLTGMISDGVTERVSIDEVEMLALYRACDVTGRLVAHRLVRSLLERAGGAVVAAESGELRLPRISRRQIAPARDLPPQPAGVAAALNDSAAALNDNAAARAMGSIISMLRKQNGMTQQAFAERLGVARSAVAQWETGRAGGAAAMHLARIAEILGTTVEVFLTGMASHDAEERLGLDEADMLRLYRRCSIIDRFASLHIIRSVLRKRMTADCCAASGDDHPIK